MSNSNKAHKIDCSGSYQPLIDDIDLALLGLSDKFRPQIVKVGQQIASNEGVKKCVIVYIDPDKLVLTGSVLWGKSYSVMVSFTRTEDRADVKMTCACPDWRCAHQMALITKFFSANWRDTLISFINPREAQTKANLSAEFRPVKHPFRNLPFEAEASLVKLFNPVTPSAAHPDTARFSLGYLLDIAKSNNKGAPRSFDLKPGAYRSLLPDDAFIFTDDYYRDIVNSEQIDFLPLDATILGKISAKNDSANLDSVEAVPSPSFTSGDLVLQAARLGKVFISESRGQLKLGADIQVTLGWEITKKDELKPALLGVPAGLIILKTSPFHLYVNKSTKEIGKLAFSSQNISVEDWLEVPKVNIELGEALLYSLRDKNLPTIGLEHIVAPEEQPEIIKPRVKLEIFNTGTDIPLWYQGPTIWSRAPIEVLAPSDDSGKLYLARLSFIYGDAEFRQAITPGNTLQRLEDLKLFSRDAEGEREAIKALTDLGLAHAAGLSFYEISEDDLLFTTSLSGYDYLSHLVSTVAKLSDLARQLDWEFSAPSELCPVSMNLEEMYGGMVEDDEESEWFKARLKLESNGKEFNLGEVLIALIKSKNDTIYRLDHGKSEKIVVMLSNQSIEIDRKRLIQLVNLVNELSDPDSSELRFNKFSGYAFENAVANTHGRWETSKAIASLRSRIANMRHESILPEPSDFRGSLRDYQQHGLAWLSNITEAELGGILADDMGLGKTVQLIALLLLERARGRKGINLVVCPKSVIPNWVSELSRFAPDLSIYKAVGANRKKHRSALESSDIVITNYAILNKDIELFKQLDFNVAIFDEAQSIKNPATASYKSAQDIKARMKIPVSGTPLENNLQDLWAHFNLSMPGFLYSLDAFKKIYRKPIEKDGDTRLRKHLAERIKPFVLRRTKQEVAKDLPPLTEIVKSCELEGQQRDLYETIRQLTLRKVREALRVKGAKRSHIEFLDALLKLRQVCCDPRLVKTQSAKKVTQSAKIDLLFDLLPNLIQEGRSIVLFSQFTSMLSIIEEGVIKRDIPYCLLTGETVDRETPIKSFQSGAKKLFLMSLKAGGVGINLTAADTVVIYDPWWNPAVEAQAICRAHRIGQLNPVFAYRLIAEGTIEEKILELQERKRLLVENLLSDNEKPPELSEELIDYLFAPVGCIGSGSGN